MSDDTEQQAVKASSTKASPAFVGRFKGNMTVEEYHIHWTHVLATSRAAFVTLETSDVNPTMEKFLKPLDRLMYGVNHVVPFAFQRCHPSPEMRREADEADKAGKALSKEMMRSPGLLTRMEKVDMGELDEGGKRFAERWLRRLKRNGAGLGEGSREELKVKELRLTELNQAFGRNIDEGNRHLIFSKADLLGVPDDFLESHEQPEEKGTYKITTEYPDIDAVTKFCSVRETRRQLLVQFRSIAHPINQPILKEIMSLKHQIAVLKGYENGAEYTVQENMLKSTDQVSEFMDRIKDRCWDIAKAQKDILQQDMRDGGHIGPEEAIQWWDRPFAINLHKLKLGADAKEIREYFPAKSLVKGLFALAQTLFKLEFVEVDVPAWHETVAVYDVLDEEKKPIGRLYADIYPRENKYSHACAAGTVKGSREGGLPEVQLTANVAGGEGALSSIGEARTLFHELGHCLHFILKGHNQEWLEFSGYDTEWDFVEAPSQMLEEWLSSKEVLRSFAVNAEGQVIPDRLIDAMLETDLFGNAMMWNTQTFYAKVLLECHREADIASGKTSVDDRYREIEKDWHVWDPSVDVHHASGMGHIPTYGANYYAYTWSQVISRDLLTASWNGNGLMDLDVAARYKELVLKRGGSKDAKDIVEEFLGRPPNEEAFGKWLEQGMPKK